MPLSVASSGSLSSSSDSDSEFSDQSNDHHERNTKLVVKYTREAQIGQKPSRGPQSWQKLHNALVDARLALLEASWTGLLKALKPIDDALIQASFGSKLEWRRPILCTGMCAILLHDLCLNLHPFVDRLKEDIARLVPLAVRKKRSLPASEAKSLSVLKQKLAQERDTWRLCQVHIDEKVPPFNLDLSNGDHAVLNSFELALLVHSTGESKHTLDLSVLNLEDLPNMLRNLPDLVHWYGSFGSPEEGIDLFDSLDLRHNRLSSLPTWLPQVFPRLKRLYITGNPMMVVSPTVTALQHLELLARVQSTRAPAPNTDELVQQARERLSSPSGEGQAVPSLALLCMDLLRESGCIQQEDAPIYLRSYWHVKRYTCASCQDRIFPEDPRYIPTPLRERYTHFDPPVSQLTPNGQLPRGISRNTHVVSSPEWTFCAPCLILHSAPAAEKSVAKCTCIACVSARRLWSDEKKIRWTKLRVNA